MGTFFINQTWIIWIIITVQNIKLAVTHGAKFFSSKGLRILKCSSDYHLLNLSLIALNIMQLLVRIKSHFSLNIINTDLSNQDLFNRGTVKMSKILETKYSRMGQVKMVRLGRPYHFTFFKGCLHKFYLVHSWILCPICCIKTIIELTQ